MKACERNALIETGIWKSNAQKAIFASGLMGRRGKVVIAVSGLLLSQNDGGYWPLGVSPKPRVKQSSSFFSKTCGELFAFAVTAAYPM